MVCVPYPTPLPYKTLVNIVTMPGKERKGRERNGEGKAKRKGKEKIYKKTNKNTKKKRRGKNKKIRRKEKERQR